MQKNLTKTSKMFFEKRPSELKLMISTAPQDRGIENKRASNTQNANLTTLNIYI